jgi:putative ABC transport system permease protein
VPGTEVGGSSSYYLKNSLAAKRCRNFGVDKDFIPNYGLEVIAGRNFTNDHPAVDTNFMVNIILNETAAKIFVFTNTGDVVGQYIDGSGFHCKVIGVVKDYHQESLQHSFDPIVFYPEEERNFGNFSLKFLMASSFVLLTTTLPLSSYHAGIRCPHHNCLEIHQS